MGICLKETGRKNNGAPVRRLKQQGGRTIGKETIRLEERIGKIGINSMPKCKCVRMQEDSWTIGSFHRTTIAIFLQRLAASNSSPIVMHTHELIEII